MKEQDAAHSFEKEDDDIRGHHEPDDRPQSMIDLAEKIKLEEQLKLSELTRLRSELQQKDKIIKELIPLAQENAEGICSISESYKRRAQAIVERAKESLKES